MLKAKCRMVRNEKIIILRNEIEANVMESILKEGAIPHIIVSYHDSVYDGIWQLQKGWGHIEAPIKYKEEILNIYQAVIEK